MADAAPVTTPMTQNNISQELSPSADSREAKQMETIPYRETVGSLIHIMRCTRPDIAYAVSVVSRYMHNPNMSHWRAVTRILQYLKGTISFEFQIPRSTTLHQSLNFQGYSDADWARNLDNGRSTSGYGFYLGSALVSWRSRGQDTVATSTTHAEYIAAYDSTAECLWTRNFLNDLALLPPGPTLIHCDNDAARKISMFHMVTPRSKHLATKLHFVRDQVTNQSISLTEIPGRINIADIWTKPLGRSKFTQFRTRLNVLPIEACQTYT